MKYEYQSVLKDVIQDLIEEKHSLGFKYEASEWKLKELDQLAVKEQLDHIEITRGFAEKYIGSIFSESPLSVKPPVLGGFNNA